MVELVFCFMLDTWLKQCQNHFCEFTQLTKSQTHRVRKPAYLHNVINLKAEDIYS